ncbi:MAG TPA: HAD-IIB family hydrolase [Bryobacteraceae bacterium]|nr:HAD-IIB family hydrolase [Bryobacteraceae bacterium]
MTKILFTDLDGTLLHPHTYSTDPARPALDTLKRLGIPVVLCTSKTRPEVEYWREKLDITDPFIVENGGAIYIPRGYFPFPLTGTRRRGEYDVVECGTPYAELVATLKAASTESGCGVLGFHEMSLADIAVRSLLPVRQAELARQREYDEPFEVLGPWGTHRLLEAIERRGKRWTRGDRFYHITGDNSKAAAVRRLAALYARAFGELSIIGVGNAHNDTELLRAVDIPIIIQSRFAATLRRAIPHATVTRDPGPHGWNDAVLEVVGGELVSAASHAL